MAKTDLTAQRLRELLHYDPETGVFTRRIATGRHGCFKAGEIAGSKNTVGYVEMGIDSGRYLAHRVAVLYMTGEWPRYMVDHLDTVRDNNRWSNLRDAPELINRQNLRRAHKSSISGFLGASKHRNKWSATIRVGGKRLRLGTFETPEEAHAAYVAAKRIYHEGNTL